MPHLRDRHLFYAFTKVIRHSRIVGILGHRQVGKTTFIEENSKEYVTLDDHESLLQAQKKPKEFLSHLKGAYSAIDECQLAPPLFPALKLAVQKNKQPGQFILSGSVRFTSRKAIRESLTGRIANLEMFPMVVTELDEEPNSDFFCRLLTAENLKSLVTSLNIPASLKKTRNKTIQQYFKTGGFPGLCFIRDQATRKSLLEDTLQTILDRDIRLVYPTTVPYSQILEYCRELALSPMEDLNLNQVRKKIGLSEATQKKLLSALESVFLIRRLKLEGDYKGYLNWFEDQTERYFFADLDQGDFQDWTSCVYRHARAQFGYRLDYAPVFFSYLTRAGANMPIGVHSHQRTLGIYPLFGSTEPNKAQLTSAKRFLSTYLDSKVVFVTDQLRDAEALSENSLIVSAISAFY